MKRILLKVLIFVIALAFTTTTFAERKYIQYDLDRLAKKSEKRLRGLDEKIAKAEKEEKTRKKLRNLNNLYAKAEALYNQGRYSEAKSIYLEIKGAVKDADLKTVARQKAKELDRLRKEKMREERAKRKAEKKRQKGLEKQRKAREIAAKRAAIKRKTAAKKVARKTKIATKKMEIERKTAARKAARKAKRAARKLK